MKYSQDVTSQAMIEVSLALSMAFFSLLILVLVTMKLPELTNNDPQKETFLTDTTEKINVAINLKPEDVNNTKRKPDGYSKQAQTQYVFYHNSQFYNQHLNRLDTETLNKNKVLIIAVPENLTLIELIQLKKQINHPNASITNLSQNWINALEQLP